MGVPKFFRYISERYPCLSELVKEYQIPEFDNLYLDMNGIIHMCSHPDDNNPHFRITEERIFQDIFHYIEVLFRMIQPQKLFFMAVDGVAPRAKMNQQRGRRFRSAKEAEKMEKEAKTKGEVLPDAARFDSNCITPGTAFMARLHEQLKYFVVEKISNDPLWSKCNKIILSGHETPGEGEHKIMDYIRYMRAQPGYDPNTRHCLYGLDADLIMLGLCTHDPHFSLLREEVKFGKKSTSKRTSVPEEIKFYLLHLSLMREYLELEFKPLKDKLEGFQYDFEKIIDDWVLMGFLVGNDFIPNLPNLHIANGALPILYTVYREVLPTLDGYINEGGSLNLQRFAKFMEKLSEIDVENFEEIRDDLLYMEAKTGRKSTAHPQVSMTPRDLIEWSPDDDESPLIEAEALEPEKVQNAELRSLIQATDEICDSSDENENSGDEDSFQNFKNEYYRNKLEYLKVTPEVLRSQAEGYVRAIQWNLNYYYNGVCSWSWYYPHHYAPYISDIKGFSDLKLEFDLGKPFLPYEQLLAVLPTASKNLLPTCYHRLMTDENSEIHKYYPEEFQTDLNGKKQEWEAVVLVPFIDEKLLLKAMKPCNELLNTEEKERNAHGPMLVFSYTPENLGVYRAPEYFNTVAENHAFLKTLHIDDIRVPKEKLVKGAYPGVKMDVYYPGFPTFKHLKYEGEVRKSKIKVFETPSRNENMIITIIPDEKLSGDVIPVDYVGATVFVGWPHLVEAKVVAISNSKRKYLSVGEVGEYNTEDRVSSNKGSLFDKEKEGILEYYKNRLGIDCGSTKVLVYVQVMIGRRYMFTQNGRITLEKKFSNEISIYPLQSVVFNITPFDAADKSVFRDVSTVFPEGCTCFTLTNPYYGSQGKVLDSRETLKNGRIKIQVSISNEPNLSVVKEIADQIKRNYKSLYNAAGQLSISNYVFSRITGSIYMIARNNEGGFKNVSIGLELKFNKRNHEVPGYTKKMGNSWYYSDRSIDLVRSYIEKFPEVFTFLSRNDKTDNFKAEDVFGSDYDDQVKSLQNWLKEVPSHSVEKQPCGSSVLELDVVKEIEKIVDKHKENIVPKTVTMLIKPTFIFRPEIQIGSLLPDGDVEVQLLDRIINVREGFSVPLGLKGTVISINETGSQLDKMYDVVFDSCFKDGMELNCSPSRGYRVPLSSFINISFGQRKFIEKMGKPDELVAKAEANKKTTTFEQNNSAFAPFPCAPQVYPIFSSVPTNSNPGVEQVRVFNKQQTVQNRADNRFNLAKKNVDVFMPEFSKVVNENGASKSSNSVISSKPNETGPNKEPVTEMLKNLLKIGGESTTNNEKTKISNGVNPSTSSINPSPNMILSNIFSQSVMPPATVRLLTYYQSNNMGLPKYQYSTQNGLYQANLRLKNGRTISKLGKSREEAAEHVAAEALQMLISFNSHQPILPVPPKVWVDSQSNTSPRNNKTPGKVVQQNSYKSNTHKSQHSQHSTFNNSSLIPLQVMKNRRLETSVKKSTVVTGGGKSIAEGSKMQQDTPDKNTKKGQNKSNSLVNDKPKPARRIRIAANFGKPAN